MLKKCNGCNLELPLDKFNREKGPKGNYYHRATCKNCRKIYRDEYYIKNQKMLIEKSDKYRQKNRELVNKKCRDAYHANPKKYTEKRYWSLIKKTYKLTAEDYKTMMENQENKCKICKTPKVEIKKKFAVDHCHNSNIVRGLLCENCNRGIGLLKENVDTLSRAIEYIKNKGNI